MAKPVPRPRGRVVFWSMARTLLPVSVMSSPQKSATLT